MTYYNDPYEDPEDAPDDLEICEMCGGILLELGTLGRRKHSRCQNCGAQFSHVLEPRP